MRGGFGAERAEEGMETAVDDAHLGMALRPVAHVQNLPTGRAAAVVAESEVQGDVFDVPRIGFCESLVKARQNLCPVGSVPADFWAVAQDAGTGGGLPPEGGLGGAKSPWERAREREVGHSGGGENLRHAGRVSEGVRGPRGAGTNPEVLAEVVKPHRVLAHERLDRGEVGVGLNDRAADDVPAPGLGQLADAAEGFGVELLQMPVEHGLAAHVGEFGELVHEGDGGAHGADALVEPLPAVP